MGKILNVIVLLSCTSIALAQTPPAQESPAQAPKTKTKLPPKSIYDGAGSSDSPASEVSSTSSDAGSVSSAVSTAVTSSASSEVSANKSNSSIAASSSTSASTAEVPEVAELPNLKRVALEKEVKLLEELVNISSDTKLEVDGVNKVQSIVERELKTFKFKIEEASNPQPFTKSAKLLIATFPGKSEQYITLLAHADTVFPATGGFSKFVRLGDEEASGPGVIDDKGGLVIAIEALKKYLSENPTPPYSLRLIVSPSEEVGSTGFLQLFEQFSLSSIAVLGLEPALDQGDIIDSRKGDRWYDVIVHGREAHAGRAHEQGINACYELAMKIEKLQKLTNYKKGVTVNVGAIKSANDKYSIVCGEASMKVDLRFADMKSREKLIKNVEGIINKQYVQAKSDGAKATTEWSIVDDPKPFPEEAKSKPLIDLYKKIILDLEGQKIAAKKSGGTSDINYFYRPGLVVLDGLGAVGAGMHTHDEKIEIRSLLTRADALSKLIQASSL